MSAWIKPSEAPHGRFLIGPHAGLKFCGEILGQTYARLSPDIARVFILSPSHAKYFRQFRVSQFCRYQTPLGDLEVDITITGECHRAGIEYLDATNDIEEHGIEMHLPFLKFVAPNAKIVPIVVCDMQGGDETAIKLLGEYFDDQGTAFIVSTDFCHWGKQFEFRLYRNTVESQWKQITGQSRLEMPIWQSIEQLDRLGMDAASTGNAAEWTKYINNTENTVCGQAPLGLVLKTANTRGYLLKYEWLGYAQSSRVLDAGDMSVSYASAVCIEPQVSSSQ